MFFPKARGLGAHTSQPRLQKADAWRKQVLHWRSVYLLWHRAQRGTTPWVGHPYARLLMETLNASLEVLGGTCGHATHSFPEQWRIFLCLLLMSHRDIQDPHTDFKELQGCFQSPFWILMQYLWCPKKENSLVEIWTKIIVLISNLWRHRVLGSENRTKTHIQSVLSSSG